MSDEQIHAFSQWFTSGKVYTTLRDEMNAEGALVVGQGTRTLTFGWNEWNRTDVVRDPASRRSCNRSVFEPSGEEVHCAFLHGLDTHYGRRQR
jgi:hypothetical protein